jgi:hypothetical protein
MREHGPGTTLAIDYVRENERRTGKGNLANGKWY